MFFIFFIVTLHFSLMDYVCMVTDECVGIPINVKLLDQKSCIFAKLQNTKITNSITPPPHGVN